MTFRDSILRYLLGRPEGCWPSSVREIADAVGLRSSATAHYHLRVLQQEGLVESEGRKGFRATRKEAAA